MQHASGGWWEADVSDAGPGTDYGFVLDGAGPFPDPRSPWQPAGVHGPSRSVDHTAFPWTDRGWRAAPLASAVLYELHVGTFTPAGPSTSAIERLDHLRGPRRHARRADAGRRVPRRPRLGLRRGRSSSRPTTPTAGPRGCKRLVDACHARGLAVVLDVVYNHLGPDRQLPAALRAVLHGASPDAVGRRGQPRRPGQRRGAALRRRQRPEVAARLPRRRAPARRRARDRRHVAGATSSSSCRTRSRRSSRTWGGRSR